MKTIPFDTLKLNGSTYSSYELVHLANGMLQLKKLSEQDKSLLLFIKEWISPATTVKVKTSGSTGTPKVIEVSKEQMLESAKMTCRYFHITKRSNVLLCLSPEYIAGKMMLVRAFYSGANLVAVEPSSNPLRELNHKIDFAALVPLQVEEALSNAKTRKVFNSIENVIIGGATVPKKLAAKLAKCTNNVYSTFAMTETLSHFALRRLSGKKKSELFEVLPGISITTDKRGCMIVNAPLLNEAPIVTNDIIEIIDEQHFKWLGRYDNVINSGGVKIHPEKLEEKLSAIIKDKRFFVAALPDKKLGQKLVLIIEGANRSEVSKIKKAVERISGKYEKPKKYIVIQKFAETPNGKIQRKETLQILSVSEK
ncbi:MAG TPA: AMP-binding protein [Bacteroidia bacterium]|nr:AMP-binding protein [Bacteroidia bacterium]